MGFWDGFTKSFTLDNIAKGVGIASAGASIYGAYKGVKQGQQQIDLARQQAEWARQQEEKRRELYGSLEQNLVDYYTSLTPEKRVAIGLDRYDQQFKLAKEKVEQNMAQRGLMGSGIEQSALAQMEQQVAYDRVNLATQLEDQTQQQRLGFLGLGQGKEGLTQQMMANASNQHIAALGQQQANWNAIAQQSGQAAGDIFGALLYKEGRLGKNRFGDE